MENTELEQLVRDAQKHVSEHNERVRASRPKSAADGAKQGLRDFVGGIGVGVTGLVGVPIASVYAAPKDKKLLGAVQGVVGGLAVAIGAPVAGTVSGVQKVREGIKAGKANKNAKAIEAEHGPQYSTIDGIPSSLSAEEVQQNIAADREAYLKERQNLYHGFVDDISAPVGASRDSSSSTSSVPLPMPKDVELYDVLGVSYTASASDIRRAYHKRSLATHPDRNPGSDGEEFKRVSQAFQILSNDEKRLAYHRSGVDGIDDDDIVSAEVLFSLMLMPKGFKPIIGDAAHAAYLGMASKENSAPEPSALHKITAEIEEFNKKRVGELSELLKLRVEPFVQGRGAEFVAFAEREVQILSAEPLGRDVLHCVGYAYSSKAKLLRGKQSSIPLRAFFSELADTGAVLRREVRTAQSVLALHIEDLEAENSGSLDHEDSERRKIVTGLSAVFLSSLVDIQSVLREVVEKCCADPTVSKEVNLKRIEAVHALGSIFMAA